MRRPLLASDRGMTLIEVMVALTIFSLIVALALKTLQTQSEGYRTGTDRMTLLQNLRFAANTLERDMRVAAANTPDFQPYFLLAGSDVFAFSGDYATNIANDPFAVYYDPDSPAFTVRALHRGLRFTFPNSSFTYPDTNYLVSGVNSMAETLIFFFRPDSSTVRTDDYALFKQINRGPAALVARNLLKTNGADFFQYFKESRPTGQPVAIVPISAASLPLVHSAMFHLSTADTGAYAVIDSIRGVRVSFTTTNGRTGDDEQLRALSRLIRMPNAGLATKLTCGDEPLLGSALGAVQDTTDEGDPYIQLTWNQAIDEGGGERDVVRYGIWRRVLPNLDWGDPFLSIPAGQASYVYRDDTVESASVYAYAMAAQDCTPSLSGLVASPVVAVP